VRTDGKKGKGAIMLREEDVKVQMSLCCCV